jgi:hypothetical protein
MPAETEHDRVPTWTRRGCASATTAAASMAMPATADKKYLGDMFLPQLTPNRSMIEISLGGKLCGRKQMLH